MDLNNDESLFEAILNEDYREVAFLLSIGANPNRIFSDHGGISPFHIAVGLGSDLKYTKLFLNNNGNVNLKSENDGWTPLHVCAYWNKFESFQLLLLNNADPNIVDKKGRNAIDVAKENNSNECIKVLSDFISLKKSKSTPTALVPTKTQPSLINKNETTTPTRSVHRSSRSRGDLFDISSISSIESNSKNDPYVEVSTFDESNIDNQTQSKSKSNSTQRRKRSSSKKRLTPSELESIISDLIDLKLGIKQQAQSSQQKNQTPINKTILKNSNKKVDSETQTKITNKRFYSPEKLPVFYNSPNENNNSNDENKDLLKKSVKKLQAPLPPPAPPLPTSSQPATSKISQTLAQTNHLESPNLVTRETQTTGKLVRIKPNELRNGAVPPVSLDVLNELNSKFNNINKPTDDSINNYEPIKGTNCLTMMRQNVDDTNVVHKLKNWINKLSTPIINTFNHNHQQYPYPTTSHAANQNDNIGYNDVNVETKIKTSASVSSFIIEHQNQTKFIQQTQTQTEIKEQYSTELRKRASSLVTPCKIKSLNAASSSNLSQIRSADDGQLNVSDLYSNKTLKTPNKNTSNLNMTEFITDRIGYEFFHDVLGKSKCNKMPVNSQTPIKSNINYNQSGDGPINSLRGKKIQRTPVQSLIMYQAPNHNKYGDLETTFVDNDENVAFKETLLTSDCSTIITNDEFERNIEDDEEDEANTTKKSTSTYKTATDSMNDYIEILDMNDLNKSKENSTQKTEITIRAQPIIEANKKQYDNKGYSSELIEELENKLNITTTSDIIEANMFKCFQQKQCLTPTGEKIEWREGNIKSAFNYLLIDPRITKNLPSRAKFLNAKDVFRIFISGIFYIGKGSRARPYAHLYDSLKYWKNNASSNENLDIEEPKSKKIKRIVSIWNENYGVVSLHCFQSVIPSEAYTREAAMIDAIGLENLTNMKKGNYYGEAKEWNAKYKRQLGTILLRRACAIFLAEGERQITPVDI